MNTKSKLILSIATIVAASSVGAHDLDANAKNGAAQGKSRAEVRAEVELWRQAGLDRYSTMEGIDVFGQDYQRQLAEYQQLRNGPAFEAALRRNQSRDSAHAGAAGDAQSRSN